MNQGEQLKDIYCSLPHEPLIPTKQDNQQYHRKFNSITHFVSYTEHLNDNFKRGSSSDSSESEGYSFTSSDSMKDAYERIRSSKFDANDTNRMQALIREVKKQTRFEAEGDELAVPEYIAGSDKYWVKSNPQKKPAKIIEDFIFIDVVASAWKNAQVMQRTALDILIGIYKRNIIPRKIVITLWSNKAVGSQDVITFIDVNFSDLHGIAKAMHPSTFRRLHFRMEEIFPGLNWGYGKPSQKETSKGYISVDYCYGGSESALDLQIDTLLGVIKK